MICWWVCKGYRGLRLGSESGRSTRMAHLRTRKMAVLSNLISNKAFLLTKRERKSVLASEHLQELIIISESCLTHEFKGRFSGYSFGRSRSRGFQSSCVVLSASAWEWFSGDVFWNSRG